jgi:hypothetical protein
MFKDMSTATDINQEFKNTHPDAKLGVQVLSSAFWPMNALDFSFIHPPQFTKPIKTFEMFYAKKFEGRCLRWLFQMGNCDLKVTFNTG